MLHYICFLVFASALFTHTYGIPSLRGEEPIPECPDCTAEEQEAIDCHLTGKVSVEILGEFLSTHKDEIPIRWRVLRCSDLINGFYVHYMVTYLSSGENVMYEQVGPFTDTVASGAASSYTITPMLPGTVYEIQVQPYYSDDIEGEMSMSVLVMSD